MERRKPPTRPNELTTSLPKDYLRLVVEVFQQNFRAELERLSEYGKGPAFEAVGTLFPTEAVLSVSLVEEGKLGATTVHASSDFALDEDNAPIDAEARLSACVDAIGGVFSELLAPEALPRLKLGTLATLAEVPPGWSETNVRDRAIYLLVDSSNPRLETLTDEWLKTHAPAEPPVDEDPIDDEPAPPDDDASDDAAPAAPALGDSALGDSALGDSALGDSAHKPAPTPTKH